MIGLFVISLFLLWGWFSVWLGRRLAIFSMTFLTYHQFSKDKFLKSLINWFCRVFFTSLILLLPFLDQLIAYPKWQRLCANTADLEWGPNMDEKRAYGREVTTNYDRHQFTIFPNIKVEASSLSVYDAKTNELIFRTPHFAFVAITTAYLPSASGYKNAIFLPKCATYGLHGENWEKKLQLTEVYN